MNKSDSIGALAAALAKAQGQMTFASKDATNPHFRAKYADLASIVDAIRKPLSENGLAYSQLCDFTESGGLIIETVLMHESGEWISGRMQMPIPKNDPQGVGSATTYGKRYCLAAIVGIASDDDDDGEAAMGRGKGNQQEGAGRQQKGQQKQQEKQQGQTKEQATPDQLAKIRDFMLAIVNRDGGTEAEALKRISEFKTDDGKEIWLTPATLDAKCTKGYAGKIISKAEAIEQEFEKHKNQRLDELRKDMPR